MTDGEFRVLMVCTANVCRSPAAALLFRSLVADTRVVTVASGGTRAMAGSGMVVGMMEHLPPALRLGASAFSSRQVTVQMLREADLILGMTRDHRSEVVQISPSSVRNTFTVREFARLMDRADFAEYDAADTVSAMRLMCDRAGRRRAITAGGGKHDDIVDPRRMSKRACGKVLEQIQECIEPIAQAFSHTVVQREAPPSCSAHVSQFLSA